MEVQREDRSVWFDALLFLLISCIQQRLPKLSSNLQFPKVISCGRATSHRPVLETFLGFPQNAGCMICHQHELAEATLIQKSKAHSGI